MSNGIPQGVPTRQGLWRTGSVLPGRGPGHGLARTGLALCLALGWILSRIGPPPASPLIMRCLGAQPSSSCLELYTRGLGGADLLQMTRRLDALKVPYHLHLEGDPRATWLQVLLPGAASRQPPPARRGAALPFLKPGWEPPADPTLLQRSRERIG